MNGQWSVRSDSTLNQNARFRNCESGFESGCPPCKPELPKSSRPLLRQTQAISDDQANSKKNLAPGEQKETRAGFEQWWLYSQRWRTISHGQHRLVNKRNPWQMQITIKRTERMWSSHNLRDVDYERRHCQWVVSIDVNQAMMHVYNVQNWDMFSFII